MTDLDKKEEAMRAYWLGFLNDSQVEVAEMEWFSSDEDTELLEFARTDLIDDYLNENLTTADRSQFEKYFLLDNLEDVAIAQSLLKAGERESSTDEKSSFFELFFNKVSHFISVPQVAFAFLLLISFGLVFSFYFYKNGSSPEIARKTETDINSANNILPDSTGKTETDADDRVPFDNGKDVSNSKNEAKNTNAGINKNPTVSQNSSINKDSDEIKKSSNTHKKPENPQIVFLTIFRGSAKTVNLSSGQPIIFKLVMPGIDKAYKSYEMRVYDAQNNLVAKQVLNKNLASKKSGETFLTEPLKADFFKKNDVYKTALFGIDADTEATELSSYDNFKID